MQMSKGRPLGFLVCSVSGLQTYIFDEKDMENFVRAIILSSICFSGRNLVEKKHSKTVFEVRNQFVQVANPRK
jgi:hypothetical protein